MHFVWHLVSTTEYREATWDAWNRLRRIQKIGSGSTSGTVQDVWYKYDGLTRRTQKSIVTGANTGTVSYFYNSAWKCLEEYEGSSTTPSKRFIYGVRGRNDLVLRDRDTNSNGTLDERLYALSDAMGSITAITDDAGVVEERYRYQAFGPSQVLQPDFSDRTGGSDHDWQVRFHGELRDDETGYYNYGYRYYLPELGRWPSRDPIEENGGSNLYAMVGNNPFQWIDWLGRWPTPPEINIDIWTRHRQKSKDQIHRKRNKKGGGMDRVQDTYPTADEKSKNSEDEDNSVTFTFYLIDESQEAEEAECKKGDIDFDLSANADMGLTINPGTTGMANNAIQIGQAFSKALRVIATSPPGQVLNAIDTAQTAIVGGLTLLISTGHLFTITVSGRYRCCVCEYSIGGPHWHWGEWKDLTPQKVKNNATGDFWGTNPEMLAGVGKALQNTFLSMKESAKNGCSKNESQ